MRLSGAKRGRSTGPSKTKDANAKGAEARQQRFQCDNSDPVYAAGMRLRILDMLRHAFERYQFAFYDKNEVALVDSFIRSKGSMQCTLCNSEFSILSTSNLEKHMTRGD
jgi:hypothetical protein